MEDVHPKSSVRFVAGTLQVGIAEEDTGRVMDFNVSQGSAIVVPQGTAFSSGSSGFEFCLGWCPNVKLGRLQNWQFLNSAGLIHYMKNNNCTSPLQMLTVFNNVDAGELTLLDKILAFPEQNVLASTGLDEASYSLLKQKYRREQYLLIGGVASVVLFTSKLLFWHINISHKPRRTEGGYWWHYLHKQFLRYQYCSCMSDLQQPALDCTR